MTGQIELGLLVAQVQKSFGRHYALNGVDLEVREGEFFTLLGPSGCGKTTLRRLSAGLELPDSGHICLGGRDITRLPAAKREVNTVFQSYALFPHLDIFENVAFGL
ncbi:MAG: ATP-binding cassette domain-containing protein, partial [Candidatus Adiutrix sp.]|nr:ATP-binding cassette domain-containing protein [Candidatus Adiutrix sp.]